LLHVKRLTLLPSFLLVRLTKKPNDVDMSNSSISYSALESPDIRFMRMALRQAQRAEQAGEVPVGAVIVHEELGVIGQAYNSTETLKDPTAHAEILAITQAAAALGDWRLTGTTLYVTKEPCPMCAGAIVLARIPRVIWGMSDPQRGGALSRFKILQDDQLNHRADCVVGVLEEECREIVQRFFKKQRARSGSASADDAAPTDSAP
jgi:tRNA(adenine34) deaminase